MINFLCFNGYFAILADELSKIRSAFIHPHYLERTRLKVDLIVIEVNASHHTMDPLMLFVLFTLLALFKLRNGVLRLLLQFKLSFNRFLKYFLFNSFE